MWEKKRNFDSLMDIFPQCNIDAVSAFCCNEIMRMNKCETVFKLKGGCSFVNIIILSSI